MPPKKDMLKCGYCSGKARLQCNQCEFWQHRDCMSGISEEFFNYPEAQSKDGNMGWMCEKCHKVIKTEVSVLAGRVKELE